MSRPVSTPPDETKRTPKLRARRIAVDTEKLGAVRASMRHPELGVITGDVQDLSLHGIGLVIPASNGLAGLLLSGDRVEGLEVSCGTRTLFRGSGIVRRVAEQNERQIVGVELDGDGIDLSELYLEESRQSFAQRWHQLDASGRYSQLVPGYKEWVADFRGYLEQVRAFLESEEKQIAAEDRLTREQTMQQYLDELLPGLLDELFERRNALNTLVTGLSEAEHATHRAYFRLHVLPLIAESPLLRRSFEKPLGYAGDYEMMNMLYRDHAEGTTLFGKALNVYAAREGAAQANINRLEFLGDHIRQLAAASDRPRIRIASVGCGPAREIAVLLSKTPEIGRRLEIALIDQEERSIAYCERTLAPLVRNTGARIQFIRESVRKLVTTKRLAEALGERELIYSAGLFDYLSERMFGALLGTLYSAVSPGGHLIIGNVNAQNPSRWMMEYYCDWFLNHRTGDELQILGDSLVPAPAKIAVTSEPTGINLFLHVVR